MKAVICYWTGTKIRTKIINIPKLKLKLKLFLELKLNKIYNFWKRIIKL